MKKILFINQYITHLFIDIINDFVDQGVDVEVITGGIHSSSTLSDKVKVRKLTGYNRNNTFNRLFTWHLFGIQVFFILLFQKRPIFVCTNPPFLPIIAWLYSRMRNQTYFVLYYDLYPEALERLGYISKRNPVYRIWNKLNKKVLFKAKGIFTISEKLKETINNWHPKGIIVIPPWIDHTQIKPLEKRSNPFIKDLNLQDKFIILYSGNMGLTHDIETILHAAGQLKAYQEITFLIIGDGPKKKWADSFKRENKLNNVRLLPWQPEEQLPYTFSAADIGIVTLGKNADGISVPSKTYSYLAAGVALLAIADHGSDLSKIVREYNCGAVFSPGDTEKIVDFVLRLKAEPELLASCKSNARKASLDFGKENAAMFFEYISSNP